MSIKWNFLSNQHGEIKGINDSGVATFRGTPLKSLAREICQNSLDAFIDESTPVVVQFHCFDFPVKNIPGSDELKDSFIRSKEYWGGQKTSQTRDFFDIALKEYEKETIPVLRISDFNTKGLSGSRKQKDTDWTNLTKSSGVSDKHGTAGGSFGIGKYATFACSKFSTVFYSTYDYKNEQAYQGVSRIVTFTREDGEDTTGLGFYGEEQNQPVYEQLNLDPEFNRKLEQYGTDIFIIAYDQAQSEWKREIILSIIDSFLVAFWKNKLKVYVEDVEISKDTLPTLMEEFKDSIESYASDYYKVLTSTETKWIEDENFYGLGKIKFGVLIFDDDASRRVAMVRQTGMKIKDQSGISGYIPFMGVMLIEGDKINEQLRVIENPQHTEWEPQRSTNEQAARSLIKALNDFMKKTVSEFAMQGNATELDAIGLGDLLPDDVDSEDEKAKEESVVNSTEVIESKVIIQKMKKPVVTTRTNPKKTEGKAKEDADDLGWQPNPNTGSSPPHPPQPIDDLPGEKTKIQTTKPIRIEKFVFVALNNDRKKGKYILNIVPADSGDNGTIELQIAGEIYDYPATIKSAVRSFGDALAVEGNLIHGIQFEKGKQLRITVELDHDDYCALEVSAYAN